MILKKKMLTAAAAGFVTIWLASCGGATGPEGPAGPPADRSKLYCRTHSDGLNYPSSLSVSVRCDSETDIPWQGFCEASELPTGLYLSVNDPLDWDDMSARPGWTCSWAAYGVVPSGPFGGTAGICCYPVGTTQ